MNYQVVSSAEFTYPDVLSYPSGSREISLISARGSYACCQVILSGLRSALAKVALTGAEGEIYSLMPVYVEKNHGLSPESFEPHFPERKAPYYVYDCVRPFSGQLITVGDRAGLYVSIPVPKDAEAGVIKGELDIECGGEKVSIPVSVTVYKAVVPDTSISLINGYSTGYISRYQGIAGDSDEMAELDEKYMKMLRRARQNMMYVGGVTKTKKEDGSWEFDTSRLEAMMEKYEKRGFDRFFGPSIGWRQSWSKPTILLNGEIPSMTFEGYQYLQQYMPAIKNMLDRRGWNGQYVMGVADEPNTENSTEYRALCGMIKSITPDIRLADAMSWNSSTFGALDVCIPLNSEYDKHKEEFDYMRAHGTELWHYVCCVPRYGKYINRFMDYPLLSSQYIFWGNYAYGLTGYLHWAAADWQPKQNPYIENCPEHHNTDSVCWLPSGDTHIIYPGDGEPWMSLRLEAQRSGEEEYELLKLLSESDKKAADALCAECFTSFCDVEYDVSKYLAAKKKLIEAVSAL